MKYPTDEALGFRNFFFLKKTRFLVFQGVAEFMPRENWEKRKKNGLEMLSPSPSLFSLSTAAISMLLMYVRFSITISKTLAPIGISIHTAAQPEGEPWGVA